MTEITVDNLIDRRHEYVGHAVNVRGILDAIDIRTGFLAGESYIRLEGEIWKTYIYSRGTLTRNDKDRLLPYLDAFLGKEITCEVGVSEHNSLQKIMFGDHEFSFR